jgi:ABC-type bacteriocin/lantibiotic exporter with double-glycine peptidase domain
VAFTARDGAHMSALLRVIAGLDEPFGGEARIGDEPASGYRLAHPGALALVTPRAVLMAGTVMENLTLFGQGATEAQALAACDVLGLRSEIERLPRGLETMVGENLADDIPGSLAQRLCLARAIALGPRILLMEEPQARLDPAADRQLLAGLRSLRGRMTIVLATSRPSYLALADRAYLIDDGRFEPMAAADTPRQAARRIGLR